MVMVAMPRMSIKEFLVLPEDDLVHELIHGEHVVNPPPSYGHERLVIELCAWFTKFCDTHNELRLLGSYSALRFGANSILSPDVFLHRMERSLPIEDWADVPVPLLVVEILSPSTARRDRTVKRDIYLAAGVAEYWIVDRESQCVERWRPGGEQPERITGELRFILGPGMTGAIDLPVLFRRAGR